MSRPARVSVRFDEPRGVARRVLREEIHNILSPLISSAHSWPPEGQPLITWPPEGPPLKAGSDVRNLIGFSGGTLTFLEGVFSPLWWDPDHTVCTQMPKGKARKAKRKKRR